MKRYHITLQYFEGANRNKHQTQHLNYYFNSLPEVKEFFSFSYWANRYERPPWGHNVKFMVHNDYLKMDETYAFSS